MGNFFGVPEPEGAEKIESVWVKFEFYNPDPYTIQIMNLVRLPPDVKTGDLPRHAPAHWELDQRQIGFRVYLDNEPLPLERSYRIGELVGRILVKCVEEPVRVLSVRRIPHEQSRQAREFTDRGARAPRIDTSREALSRLRERLEELTDHGQCGDVVREWEQRQEKMRAADREATEEEPTCIVCMSNYKQILASPCGHLAYCYSCAESLRACAVCNGRIERLQIVYNS